MVNYDNIIRTPQGPTSLEIKDGQDFSKIDVTRGLKNKQPPKLTLQNCFPVLRKAALKALKGLTSLNIILIVVSIKMKYARNHFTISCVVTGQHGLLPFSPRIVPGPNRLLHPRRILSPCQWAGP